MNIITLKSQGQVSLPEEILNQLGLKDEAMLLVETTSDGAIVLRPTEIYSLEIYSDERVEEFNEADRLAPEEAERLNGKLTKE